jgi:hypothetical protein
MGEPERHQKVSFNVLPAAPLIENERRYKSALRWQRVADSADRDLNLVESFGNVPRRGETKRRRIRRRLPPASLWRFGWVCPHHRLASPEVFRKFSGIL